MKLNNFGLVKYAARGVVFSALALLSTLAWSKAQIQQVSGAIQGGSEVVRIQLSEPLANLPTGFAIQSPARIALDFADVGNALGRSLVEINQGNLNSVNVVEAAGRSRVVLNLKKPTTYQASLQGNTLIVALDPVAATSSVKAPEPEHFAENHNSQNLPLRDVDFRRGDGGAGRIVVGLANNQVGVDIRPQGKGLVVDFLSTSLPEGLRRRLDVTDFGTPVKLITTTQQGDRVRMNIESSGEWEHSAYQSDNHFVIDIRPKKVELNKLSQGPGYTGEKLSLNFQSIEVRSLLQVIADFTNFNIVTSDTVTGALTLRLKDVPWDQALQIIMDAKGLGMRKSGTVLWIAPKDEIDNRIKKDFEAAQAIERLEPLKTQAYQLNYAKAAEMVRQLTLSTTGGGSTGVANNNRFLTERGSAISEPRTNQLFVTDTPSRLEEVRKLLATLDVPVRQVLIEARIVEARDTFGRSLGARLGGGINGSNRFFGATAAGTGSGNVTPANSNFVNLPASLAGVNTVASAALSIFGNNASRFLTLELSAMEADGQGKIISSPRLITADQTKALIEQGTEYPYSNTAPNGATTIEFKKAVLKLEVVPQITPEGSIILDLDVSKDSRGETTTQGVAIDTKHIQTQVLIENGGTVVIGGIFELEETNAVSKVPFLGDIPVLGLAFKTQTRTTSKREVLIFITPKVISERGSVSR